MTPARELPEAAIQMRLVRHARSIGLDPNLVLARFAMERFLYRLSRSRHADRFVLKGALLMLAWLGETIRPTRDVDLLGFGDMSRPSLSGIIKDVCETKVESDGVEFLASSIRIALIREQDIYGGLRATVQGRMGKARLHVQADVGVGDAITPEPVWLEYPGLLDFPRPRLRSYRPETTIAEKLHAMVVLGEVNSRMRDFFDIHALAGRQRFEGEDLARAVRATFERRRTPVPESLPLALTAAFADIRERQTQWQGFVRKNGLLSAPADLTVVVASMATFLAPVIDAARTATRLDLCWPPGGPWREAS
jgi:predicted nucleotidyltransferase component of viral defense system